MKANGELAAHFATMSARGWPSLNGRSRKNGGLFGFGDQAAAVASVARTMNDCFSRSVWLFNCARLCATSAGGAGRGDRQHGLIMYKLPKTSGCFIPMRAAP